MMQGNLLEPLYNKFSEFIISVKLEYLGIEFDLTSNNRIV